MLALLTQINWLAIIVAGLAALIIGFVWYLPPAFGLRWGNLIKSYAHLSDAELNPRNPLPILGAWFVGCCVNAVVLAFLIKEIGVSDPAGGFTLALIVWAGFGVTFSSWPVIFAKQPRGVWVINNGAYLLMQVAMALVLTLWR